jgi:hypothetical protein
MYAWIATLALEHIAAGKAVYECEKPRVAEPNDFSEMGSSRRRDSPSP